MALTTIDELFNGPWGIVAERRGQIKSGAYDAFEKVYQEEVDKRFFSISKVAELLTCHESTARILLKKEDARFIRRGLAYFYLKDDVEGVRRLRQKTKEARDEKKRTKAVATNLLSTFQLASS